MGSFSIRITSAKNRSLGNRKVSVHYGWSGSEHQYTDSSGWAKFPTHDKSSISAVYATRYKNGMLSNSETVQLSSGESIRDGSTLSFTVADD